MTEQEVGRVVAEVIPSAHLVKRCGERLGDLAPELKVGIVVPLHGVLLVDVRKRRPFRFYIDVDGIGRFVLAPCGDKFVGIIFLPRIYCHDAVTYRPAESVVA